MKSNQNMNTASNTEIVRLTVAAFEVQFQPGDPFRGSPTNLSE